MTKESLRARKDGFEWVRVVRNGRGYSLDARKASTFVSGLREKVRPHILWTNAGLRWMARTVRKYADGSRVAVGDALILTSIFFLKRALI